MCIRDSPEDLSGMSVLDIGTGSGWFATWFEQHGADVTITDARGLCDLDIFGRDHYPDLASEKTTPDRVLSDGRPVYHSSCSKGFWIMKDILGLKAEFVNARVYDICPELFGGRKFDLVFMGSVLMHLRDPIGGLMAAHRVCKHRFIATSYMLPPESEQTVTLMQALLETRKDLVDCVSWWVPNRRGLAYWLEAAGFEKFDIDRQVHLTVDEPFAVAGEGASQNQVQRLIHAFV